MIHCLIGKSNFPTSFSVGPAVCAFELKLSRNVIAITKNPKAFFIISPSDLVPATTANKS